MMLALEYLLIAAAVAASAAYVALTLSPRSWRRHLAQSPRTPAWLARRLAAGAGCADCDPPRQGTRS
jgi:hypothetical protein